MGDAGERGVKKAKKKRNLHRRYSHKIDLDNRRLARMHDKVSYFLFYVIFSEEKISNAFNTQDNSHQGDIMREDFRVTFSSFILNLLFKDVDRPLA